MHIFNFHINKKLIGLSLLIILPLVVLEIWSINRLATLGVDINKMNATASSLKLENQVLQNQIAKRSSLETIDNNAKALGFQNIKSVQKVTASNLALGH